MGRFRHSQIRAAEKRTNERAKGGGALRAPCSSFCCVGGQQFTTPEFHIPDITQGALAADITSPSNRCPLLAEGPRNALSCLGQAHSPRAAPTCLYLTSPTHSHLPPQAPTTVCLWPPTLRKRLSLHCACPPPLPSTLDRAASLLLRVPAAALPRRPLDQPASSFRASRALTSPPDSDSVAWQI
jgi:hypothetical protein